MSKRRLMVEVDCGRKRCRKGSYVGDSGGVHCQMLDDDACAVFDCDGQQYDTKGRPLRLPACLAAERDAAPLVDAETLDAWDVLARDTTAASAFTSLSQRCANALATAVEALRQMRAPSEERHGEPLIIRTAGEYCQAFGREPPPGYFDGTLAPLVFTWQGQVKP